MVRRIDYTPEEWEAHQRKMAAYRNIGSAKELENLPVKRANRLSKMTPEQRKDYEKKFIAQYGHPPRGPDKRPRPKYGNELVIEDGIRMASRKEMRRYRDLGLLLKSKEISFLARQVRFQLPGGIQYVADFVYGKVRQDEFGMTHWEKIYVEDVKSAASENLRPYLMKKSLMMEAFGIEIVET